MRDGELKLGLLEMALELCEGLPEADPDLPCYLDATLTAVSALEALLVGDPDRFMASVALATRGGGPDYANFVFTLAGVAMTAMSEGLAGTGVTPAAWLADARERLINEGSL